MANVDKRVRAVEIALGITSSYPEIEFSLVDTDLGQPRQDFNDDDIADLARNIKANSLLQAVMVKHHPTVPGRYMIVAGERRFRAMIKAGMTRQVFKLIEGPGVARSYVLSAVENLHRVNLNPIEEALSLQKLHDEEHLTWEEIHDLTGRDVAVMISRMKLLTFPQEIQDRVRRGDLPQVTVLNLAQWRTEEGEYLRHAHDLIAGRAPAADLHFRRDTALSKIHVQARLPKTPEDFATRIVKLSGHVQSMPTVLEAFLAMTTEEQSEVFSAINPSVLGKLRVRFVALYRAIEAVSERMNQYEAKRTGKGTVTGHVKPTPPIPAPAPVPKPVAVTTPVAVPRPTTPPPPPRPLPPPPPRPAASSSGPRPAAAPSRPVPPPIPRRFQVPPLAPKPASVAKITTSERGVQTWDLSTRVLAALFYSGGRKKVNLSRSELVVTLGDFLPKGADIDIEVANAIMHMRMKWRAPQKGPEEERYFTGQVGFFRRDYGAHNDIEDAFDEASQEDRSGDPIDL